MSYSFRSRFLNQEMKTIIALHDEACTVHTDNKDEEQEVNDRIFDEILAKSRLAQLLKRVFDDVISQGCTFVRVCKWAVKSFFCILI
jgi:aspartate/glutamate racemase